MVHAYFRFPSRFLGRDGAFHALFPKPWTPESDPTTAGEIRNKKCLWFFHGLGDTPENILTNTGIAELTDALDMVVILPGVENSFCLDLDESHRFGAYLQKELIPYTARVLSISPLRADHLIGGISMGGYGACYLGLERSDWFSKIICLSGALELKRAPSFGHAFEIPLPAALSSRKEIAGHPEWDLCRRLAEHQGPRPEILLCCSQRDVVFPDNQRFAEQAAALGFPVELRTAPGLHDWTFWRENLPAALEWAVQETRDRDKSP